MLYFIRGDKFRRLVIVAAIAAFFQATLGAGSLFGLTSFAQDIKPIEKVDDDTSTTIETVSVLRDLASSDVYLDRWLGYMGWDVAEESRDTRDATASTIDRLLQAANTNELQVDAALLDSLMTMESGERLKACALFFLYHRDTDLRGETPTVESVDTLFPDRTLLTDFPSKFILNYAYTDHAWQCVAEGDEAGALAFYERTIETAEGLMSAHPKDPNHIWVVYNYLFAASRLGVETMERAVDHLRVIVARLEPCVLTWTARYQIGLFSQLVPSIPDEHTEQYAIMVDQMDDPFMLEALVSPDCMRDSKGMLELMKGHALLGSKRYSDAEIQYVYVLENFADRFEWAPRKEGRTITNRSNYGVRNSAAYSLATARHALYSEERAIASYERFVASYPDSEYADSALMALGSLYESVGDARSSIVTYRRVIEEYSYSTSVTRAEGRIAYLLTR